MNQQDQRRFPSVSCAASRLPLATTASPASARRALREIRDAQTTRLQQTPLDVRQRQQRLLSRLNASISADGKFLSAAQAVKLPNTLRISPPPTLTRRQPGRLRNMKITRIEPPQQQMQE